MDKILKDNRDLLIAILLSIATFYFQYGIEIEIEDGTVDYFVENKILVKILIDSQLKLLNFNSL